jgi:hypothetical protein
VYDAHGDFLAMAMQAQPNTPLGDRIIRAHDALVAAQNAIDNTVSFGAKVAYDVRWWHVARPEVVSLLPSLILAVPNKSFS